MFDDGLIDEVRALLEAPKPLSPVPSQGVGYREIIEFLQGTLPENQLLERIQARTRQFAKRQMTWFRNRMPHYIWYDPLVSNLITQYRQNSA